MSCERLWEYELHFPVLFKDFSLEELDQTPRATLKRLLDRPDRLAWLGTGYVRPKVAHHKGEWYQKASGYEPVSDLFALCFWERFNPREHIAAALRSLAGRIDEELTSGDRLILKDIVERSYYRCLGMFAEGSSKGTIDDLATRIAYNEEVLCRLQEYGFRVSEPEDARAYRLATPFS